MDKHITLTVLLTSAIIVVMALGLIMATDNGSSFMELSLDLRFGSKS